MNIMENGVGEKRILVVFTGGTISTRLKEGYLSPAGEEAKALLLYLYETHFGEQLRERYGVCVSFDQVSPYEILSENLEGKQIHKLYQTVEAAVKSDAYDGIIITAGTDTLAYCGAAVGYLFGSFSLPIVLVSSNYPLEDDRANGVSNFAAAVSWILEGTYQGAWIAYKNREAIFMHCATRGVQQLAYSDEFYSVDNQFYAIYEEEEWQMNPDYRGCPENMIPRFDSERLEQSEIVYIRPFPGISWRSLADYASRSQGKALVLDTYHSGTLPTFTKDYDYFVNETRKRNIPIVITGVDRAVSYESVRGYEQGGILVAPKASPAAIYMKTWLAVASGLPLEQILNQSIGGDLL